MGKNIKEGVLDGFLNVFGTKNLKVADLSISPILPDGNTSIPAQMIGLNAVRFIQEILAHMWWMIRKLKIMNVNR